ncbi:energy-coupling factor transport system ATP-binding protein [Williamsia sterculiae]|uniref:Energy-coupling factor transport system ATP-binding protein n=1 Tax=Williamsia sterculiae TaxID=1344003 RepID=A0A1N7HCW0_9NOCA|nr:energy-coupling factor transport system ATP-binding protein [Williamsia sterculiae]
MGALEIAEAAALADVAAAICVLSRVLPIAGAAILVSTMPFALLAHRRRFRVSLTGAVTGVVVAFLFGGYTPANMVAGASVMGIVTGVALRRHWSPITLFGVSLVGVGVPAAAGFVGVAAVFSDYREFLFEQFRNGWGGASRILRNGGFGEVSRTGDDLLRTALDRWWITITVLMLVGAVLGCLLVYYAVRRPVMSLARRLGDPSQAAALPDDGRAVDPVPVRLRDVAVRYPGATVPALTALDLDVGDRPELLAVAGENGAGKSTLASVIAGYPPTAGTVVRPGAVGLGRPHGTALIGQRPETGVLGMRPGDDLAWGDATVDDARIEQLLATVGLVGLADAETARLSGGQLQRLAVAAALVRDPRLIISDESTAMLDGAGREDVLALYRRLIGDSTHPRTVVHVTHHPEEIAHADRVVTLTAPTLGFRDDDAPARISAPPIPRFTGGRVEVDDISFAHDAGTPWHRPVFSGFSMRIAPGETVLVVGPNGAGKSTLARILAGVESPTSGRVTLDGAPVRNYTRGALLGHQYARLSLVRARVRDDIADASGSLRPTAADDAMRAVGLDPVVFGERRVGELSVGQQRRVALAGLLAARPPLIVLDEPMSGLDATSRQAMATALARLRAAGTTIVVVTHDLAGLESIADRVVELQPLQPGTGPLRRDVRTRSQLPNLVGRTLPGTSFARRLWVGTKVGIIVAMALLIGIEPTWANVGLMAGVAAAWTVAGRVPRSALPRLPWWLLLVAVAGGVFTALGGGSPYLTVAGVRLGMGGVFTWLLLLCITVLSLYLSLLFCWTTPMVEIPAFLQRLVNIGARVRIRAQAPATAIAVALRLILFMISDFRVLLQTVAQRRGKLAQPLATRVAAWASCLPIACSLAVRNAAELARSMESRGGVGAVSRRDRNPRWTDALVWMIVVAVLVVGIAII